MSDSFETERLMIRKFQSGDAAFVYSLLNSPGWLQFIGDRNVRTLDDAPLISMVFLFIITNMVSGHTWLV